MMIKKVYNTKRVGVDVQMERRVYSSGETRWYERRKGKLMRVSREVAAIMFETFKWENMS